VLGFHSKVYWDGTKPDGSPRKLLDISRLRALGWSPKIDLETGVKTTYEWYLNQ
jgi:GDP-L-fucose synthase